MRIGDWRMFLMGRKKGVTVGSYLHFSSPNSLMSAPHAVS